MGFCDVQAKSAIVRIGASVGIMVGVRGGGGGGGGGVGRDGGGGGCDVKRWGRGWVTVE